MFISLKISIIILFVNLTNLQVGNDCVVVVVVVVVVLGVGVVVVVEMHSQSKKIVAITIKNVDKS